MSPGPVRRPTVITPAPSDRRPPLVEARPGHQPRARPWQHVHVLGDGQTLEVHAVHGSGEQLHALEVDESDPHLLVVTVVLAFTDPPTGGARHAIGYPFRARIRLSRPLAGRMALDGALGTDAQVREQELQSVIRWRAEVGLPIGRELVEQLVDDARMPDGRLYGHEVMSDDEQRWYAQAQRDKEAAADFAKGWLAVQDADLDAHSEITWYEGGEFVQYLAAGPEGVEALRGAAERNDIRRLRVVPVTYTYRELDRFHADARAALLAGGVQVQRSGPDVRSNTVSFMILGDLAEQERARRLARDGVPADAISIVPLD
jgi:hypothetical protein